MWMNFTTTVPVMNNKDHALLDLSRDDVIPHFM
jgi:hypothetical protein